MVLKYFPTGPTGKTYSKLTCFGLGKKMSQIMPISILAALNPFLPFLCKKI